MATILDPFEIAQTRNRVDAWSIATIPFEPQGWKRAFRNELKTSIQSLIAGHGEIIHASYSGSPPRGSDIENILLYNIGSGAFRNCAARGVRFNRRAPEPHPFYAHRYTYEIEPLTVEFQASAPVVARMEGTVDYRALRHSTALWQQLCGATLKTTSTIPDGAEFAMRVKLGLPPRTPSAAALIKTVFDAIIIRSQSHDGPLADDVIDRLVAATMWTPAQVISALRRDASPLGSGSLVHSFRTGVKWNPCDDRCVAGELLIDDITGHDVAIEAEILIA